jgi:hypothetical protein
MSIWIISYILGDAYGILFISFFIETPFTTSTVALKENGLSFHLPRIGIHACMI